MPRFRIGTLMIVVAVSGCAMGLGIACTRLWESTEEPVGVVLQDGTTIISYTTTISFELNPVAWLALPALGCLVAGTPLCIYLLNRRRDRRRNARP